MSETTTHEDLVQRALAGDVPAFGLLYDRTVRLVRVVAADAGPSEVDDVTHDVYLRAYRNLPTLADPARFPAWLVGIARLAVLERRRARRLVPLPDDLAGPPASFDPSDADVDAEILLRAVDRLPDDERLAIRLFFLHERNIDDTARLLERSRSGTYQLLRNARIKLARWLRESGVNR